MRGLENKKVMITGATSGIGRATAQRLHEEGAALCLVDLNEDAAFSQTLGARFIKADVGSEQGVAACNQHMVDHGIDVLINNAGITRDATIVKMTVEDWNQVLAVNLTAVFRLSQAAARIMKGQGSGVILNAASVVAHYGNFGQSNYVATKAGVIGLTKTLSKELGKYGVRVNAVAPGFILTPMVASMPEKVLAMMEEKVPLKRMGRPEDIAAAYAFLASEDAAYLTGATLNVDGGIVIG